MWDGFIEAFFESVNVFEPIGRMLRRAVIKKKRKKGDARPFEHMVNTVVGLVAVVLCCLAVTYVSRFFH